MIPAPEEGAGGGIEGADGLDGLFDDPAIVKGEGELACVHVQVPVRFAAQPPLLAKFGGALFEGLIALRQKGILWGVGPELLLQTKQINFHGVVGFFVALGLGVVVFNVEFAVRV